MATPTLAFLQNFYTDVTLYVPAEAAAAPPVPVAEVRAAPVAAAIAPAPVESKAASPAPPQAAAPLPAPPEAPNRLAGHPTIVQTLKGHSQPSAALDRLAAGPGRTAAPVAPLIPAAPAANPVREENAAITSVPLGAAAAPAVPPVMLTRFSTLGSNAQGVVLLTRLPAEQFGKLHRNVFLNKMLQALGLVMADVVLVNVESELPVALVNLRKELAATQVIAFGKNLLDATLRNTQIYEPVQFPGLGLSYLASAEVELVEYDVSLKKRLWSGLQRMFL